MPTIDPSSYSPLALAFMGDAVYGVLTRRWLLSQANRQVGALHKMAVEYVCAVAQARAAEVIAPMLTEQETAVFKRGRNAHVSHTPRGASDAEYHAATGLEALFGFLSLSGEDARINELFSAILVGSGQSK